jgi:hypothetical protein
MIEPFIFVQTAPIKEGMLESFKTDFSETVDLVRNEEPRILHFASYINEEGTEQTVIQVHPDAESMRFHMQVAAEHIRERGPRNLDFSRMRIEVYGTPTEPVLELMRELAGSGVPVAVKTLASGFNRLPEPGAMSA